MLLHDRLFIDNVEQQLQFVCGWKVGEDMPRPRGPCPTNMLDRLMLDLGKGILEFDKIYW